MTLITDFARTVLAGALLLTWGFPQAPGMACGLPNPADALPIITDTSDDTLPQSLRRPPRSVHATPYTGGQKLCDLLQLESAKYPRDFLRSFLKDIHLLDTLSTAGVDVGGTYHGKSIYLRAQPNSVSTLRAFHHEFSSVLLMQNLDAFEQDQWKAVNPDGFRYYSQDPKSFPKHIDVLPDRTLATLGFICPYSLDSLENDFNMVVQNLFHPYPEFWKLVDSCPRLKAKVGLTIRFYHHLDKRFTEQLFRQYGESERRRERTR